MKPPRLLGILAVLAVIAAFSVCAVAGPIGGEQSPPGSNDEILFLGQLYCVGLADCQAFAFWGPTAAGYVELTQQNGTPSDYVWVDYRGFLWFESYNAQCNGFCVTPPANLPLLGKLVDTGSLQEIDQFFPGGVTRPLFVQSDEGLGSTPEPSTLLLFGPASLFLFNRARRFMRG